MNFPIGTISAVLKHVAYTPLLAEIKTRTIGLSMRDGARLATVVCRDDAVKQDPVALIRKPLRIGDV